MTQYLSVFVTPEGQAETLAVYDRLVGQWTAPPEQIDVPTRAGMTHVIASGPADGEPMFLLHAFFATATSWYLAAGALSERYRVYAVDIIGDVGKSRPTGPISSIDGYADWFADLADGLGVSEFHLVGNSAGGFIATAVAMRSADRVRSLTLISPAATFHSISAFYRHMFIPKVFRMLAPDRPGYQESMDRAVDWMNDGLRPDGDWDALFRLSLRHGTGTNRVFPRVFRAAELAQITAPTMLLIGDHEKVYRPDRVLRSAARLMPRITTHVIDQAHHVAAVAQPAAVCERIIEFATARRSGGEVAADAFVITAE